MFGSDPLLLLQLMVLLLMLVDVHDALFSCVSRAPKVTVMYEEEHKIPYTHKSILTGGPEYPVPMIGVRQEVSYDGSYGVPYYEVPCNMIGVSQDVSYDVSYSVPYYEVPCPFLHDAHCPEDQLRPEGGGGQHVAWVQY